MLHCNSSTLQLLVFSTVAPGFGGGGIPSGAMELSRLVPAPLLYFFLSLLHYVLASSHERVIPGSKSHKKKIACEETNPGMAASSPRR